MTTKATPVKTKPAPEMLSIHAALANIQRDIDSIPKDRRNEAQNFNFRGIDDLYNALHPIFAAHGVLTIPTVLETTFERWLNAKQNNTFCARVKVQYDFTAADGSKVPVIGVGEAFDFGDKALNKAMSMAHKYVLLQMFQIPTAEPDGDAYTYADQQVTQTAPEDKYANHTLDQLTILRDEFMAAKQVVPQDLLGRIAVLKADAADAAATTKPKTPRANGKSAKAAETTKPAEPAPVNRVTPVTPAHATTPRAEQDLAPGAVEEPAETPEPDEFGEPADDGFGDTASQTKLDAALNFLITPELLKHPKYAGRKLSSMSGEEISTLHEKWYLKFKADIDATPAKAELRDAILLVKAQWDRNTAATK